MALPPNEELALETEVQRRFDLRENLVAQSVTYKKPYNFYDYQFETSNPDSQVLLTESSIAQTLNHKGGNPLIRLSRNPIALSKNHHTINYYLIYHCEGAIHSINLHKLIEDRIFEDLVRTSDDLISKDQIIIICRELQKLNIRKFGFTHEKHKNKLTPPLSLAYTMTAIGSMVAVTLLNIVQETSLFSNLVSITGLTYQFYPTYRQIQYQMQKNGKTPDDQQMKILKADGATLGIQTFVSTSVSTLVMSDAVHDLLLNKSNFTVEFAAFIAKTSMDAIPLWTHLLITGMLGTGLAIITLSIALARSTEENPYTPSQLAHVALVGFVAGSLMYPAMFGAASLPAQEWIRDFVNDFVQYIINLGFASALASNIGNRLITREPDPEQIYVEYPISFHEPADCSSLRA